MTSHNSQPNKGELRKVPPVRPARQQRSRETRDAILKVVAEWVMTGRFETSTVQDIVGAAGCSVGAFYGRFADKTAVLYSFYETRCQEQETRTAIMLDPTDPSDLESQLGAFIEHIVNHTMAHSAFLHASRQYFTTGKETPFLHRARLLNGRLYGVLLPVLRAKSDEFSHPNPETATLFLLALIGGLTRDALLTGAALTDKKLECGPFVTELKRAAFGYLGLKKL